MKSIQCTILLLTMLTAVHLHGQDAISIYFEFGLYKIPNNQLKTLNDIPNKYDLSDLDSVHFIGVADSVGDFKSNLKLSEKRARNVSKYFARLIPVHISSKITALGERTDFEIDK